MAFAPQAIAYAEDREQFGQSIGAFQAVAQACVDILAGLPGGLRGRQARRSRGRGRQARGCEGGHVAALRAGEAFRAVTESAVHLFGGNGLNWEHDVHLYYRRAWSAERLAWVVEAYTVPPSPASAVSG